MKAPKNYNDLVESGNSAYTAKIMANRRVADAREALNRAEAKLANARAAYMGAVDEQNEAMYNEAIVAFALKSLKKREFTPEIITELLQNGFWPQWEKEARQMLDED